MKKAIMLCLAIAAGYGASAQSKAKTNYMGITIYQANGRLSNIIVTRTDSAQEVRNLNIRLPLPLSVEHFAVEGDALMTLLKPYYNSGWKLVTFAENYDNSTYVTTFKYYLSKEEQ
jgi:hypothetical protein